MNQLRRYIFYNSRGNANMIKALALAVYIKHNVVSSTITNYTTNKLRNLTGLSYSAITKRINTLKQLGFIKFVGRNNQHLVIGNMTSHCKHRNIDLSKCVVNSVKDIEKSLYAMFMLEIQKRKDFVKHTIQSVNNPSNLEEHKKARQISKRYGYDREFKEYGISYKTIAKKLGVCLQKAFEIVKFAIVNNMIVKYKHCKQLYVKGIKNAQKFCDFNDVTFFTNNNAYKVYANSYELVD